MFVSGFLAMSIAFGAAFLDVLTEKVDNRYILCGWILGLGFQLGYGQEQGFWNFLGGAILPVVMLFGLFWFRMLGPGDIKLFSVLGGLMGTEAILYCMFYSFLFGAILSLAFLIACGNAAQRILYFSNYISTMIQTKKKIPYYLPGKQLENIHFTVPVLMGVMLYAGGFY